VTQSQRGQMVLSHRRTGFHAPIRDALNRPSPRHLRAVSEPLDPFEALGRALRAATVAPDLGSALSAIASCLAEAVGARTALVVAADADGVEAEGVAGPLAPEEALQLAVHSAPGASHDVVIRYIGVSASFGLGAPKGAVLVVVADAEVGDSAWIAETVQAFAELAELCIVHAQRLHQAERHTDSDSLTGCLTRRAIERVLAAEIARVSRGETTFSIAFFDLDGFKRVNDEHGHVRGDAVLGAIGRALKDSARATDYVGRYGGDEFLAVLPGTDAEPAAAACARLLAGAAAAARVAGVPELGLSAGRATWRPGMQATALIEEADRAMFAAKRNR
jgi:diguanylate cyclase (GGDEF)-like protein